MRKGGGEEVRSVRCMCDVCAAHGDRAAVGVDVDAQAPERGSERLPQQAEAGGTSHKHPVRCFRGCRALPPHFSQCSLGAPVPGAVMAAGWWRCSTWGGRTQHRWAAQAGGTSMRHLVSGPRCWLAAWTLFSVPHPKMDRFSGNCMCRDIMSTYSGNHGPVWQLVSTKAVFYFIATIAHVLV